jgi:hypothetical protein
MTEPILGREVGESELGTLETFPVDQRVDVRFETNELQALCPGVAHTQPVGAQYPIVAGQAALRTR